MSFIIFRNIYIEAQKQCLRRNTSKFITVSANIFPNKKKHHQRSIHLSSYNRKQFIEERIRHDGVRVRLNRNEEWTNEEFEKELLRLSKAWEIKKTRSVFMELPIHLSHVINMASKYGFVYHHARGDRAVLCKWLRVNEDNKIPLFSNHTVGVAGACYREDTNELLVVRDKGRYSKWWKFPGGYSDMGEYLGETATREVFEETGIQTEFKSVLSFRQHHGVFYDQSDFYFICRLKPLTIDINPCPEEIEECSWTHIDDLMKTENSTPFVKMICSLITRGQKTGFHNVDISEHDVENWARKGKSMKIFQRPIEL